MSKHGENISKRKDGRWEARYIKGTTDNGKSHYGYLYAKTYKEVKEKRNKSLSEQKEKLGLLINKPTIFSDILIAFLKQQKFMVKESTYAHYCNIIDTHILLTLGELYISQINSKVIENFATQKLTNGRIDGKGGLSVKTVKDMLALLRLILKYASEKGYCKNENMSFPVLKSPKKDIQVLSFLQQSKLELATKSTDDNYKFGIYLSIYTGLRIGELCALRWSDIDLDNNVLVVNRTILRIKNTDINATEKTKIIIDHPKTESSLRTIPLPSFLVKELILRKSEVKSKENYILTGTLHYIEPRNYYLKYQNCLKECGVGNFTFHALRHTFATRCIECGFDPKSLSEILGHSDVKITLERYVHPSMDLKRSHMEKLSCCI